MGFGLRDLAVNAGEVQQGMEAEGRRQVEDQSKQLDLQNKQRLTAEAARQDELQKGVRAQVAKNYQDAQDAAARANVAIRAQNQPIPVTPGYSTNPDTGDTTLSNEVLYKNPQTGEIHTDKAKAYGVVPEVKSATLFEKEFAPKISDYFMSKGEPDMAMKFEDWSRTQTGKRYLNEAHQGIVLLAGGNKAEGLKRLQDVYNSQVRDGNYGSFKDLGNGSTQLLVHDAKGNLIGQEVITDAQLGQRAATMVGPDFIARHFLETETAVAKAQLAYNLDIAKEYVKSGLGLKADEQKIALQLRSKLMEQVNQTQLDALVGKGAHVTMDQTGMHTVFTVPGQGFFEEKNGQLVPVSTAQGQAFTTNTANIRAALGPLLGATGGAGGVGGVSMPTATPAAAPAGVGGGHAPAPAAAQTAAQGPVQGFPMPSAQAIAEAKRSGAGDQQAFEGTFGPGSWAKFIGISSAQAAPAQRSYAVNPDSGDVTMGAAEAPAAAPAPAQKKPAPAATQGVRMPAAVNSMAKFESQVEARRGGYYINAPRRSAAYKLDGKSYATKGEAVKAVAEAYADAER